LADGVLNGNNADHAGSLQCFPARVLIMRAQRPGDLRWPARQQQHHFAAQIDSSQIVIVVLRNGQPVADKYDWRLGTRGVLDAHAESCFFSENDRFFFADRLAFWVSDDREAGLFLDDLSRNELHWLEVALRSARFQTGSFESGGDILSGSTMP